MEQLTKSGGVLGLELDGDWVIRAEEGVVGAEEGMVGAEGVVDVRSSCDGLNAGISMLALLVADTLSAVCACVKRHVDAVSRVVGMTLGLARVDGLWWGAEMVWVGQFLLIWLILSDALMM